MKAKLPVGKLPPEILKSIIQKAPLLDPRVILGPGIGLDCGVIDYGDRYLIMKTDPITFATEDIGWYAVQITANDIATTGAKPLWMMITALFPQDKTDEALVQRISDQLFDASRAMNITLVNAHTEITYGLDRPILVCSLIAEIEKDKLITPCGAKPSDEILLTKGIPIEGTAILAKEFSSQLKEILNAQELETAKNYTHQPGISVTLDSAIARSHGRVTAMHDPTEGGLASALWELSEACNHHLSFHQNTVPISAISQKICSHFGLNPMNTIASGALLLTVNAEDTESVLAGFAEANIPCAKIGVVLEQEGVDVFDQSAQASLPRPDQDDIAKVFS